MKKHRKKLPKFRKDRPEPGSEGFLPEQNAGNHAQQVNGPDVSPADSEANVDPNPHRSQGKHHIRKQPVPVSRWPEKSVQQAKTATKQNAAAQTPGGSGGCHRQSRCQRPPSRGSS